jgi:porphobilinogen synthase
VRETSLQRDDFVYPLFVQAVSSYPEPINSIPGQMRHTLDSLCSEAEKAVEDGVKAVILFGIPDKKDDLGSQAWDEKGIVQQAIRRLKSEFPLVVIADTCLCEYTSHGHCGLVREGEIHNDSSLELLAKVAISQARAGADLVAPSDMMDGRVSTIRAKLDKEGFDEVAILSYAAKYASSFYAPFRQAVGSTPQVGDRSTYQIDPANSREAIREVLTDIEEGADIVMVKPALAYLDIIREVRHQVNVPVAAYSVSGEYSMIELAAMAGALDRQRTILEVLLSIKRAGADMIFTYHAREAAKWVR